MGSLTPQSPGPADNRPFLIRRLGEFVEARMGLHFPPERLPDLERGICAAAGEFGFTEVEPCMEWLLSSPLSHSQIEVLASHLTVGETYFFRDNGMFEILRAHVLPEIIDSRSGRDQKLRIWSAGCSTGEEPYSIAILLSRMLFNLNDWNITILGTDISPLSLKKASKGVYREWSFRDTPNWVKDGYFKRTDNKYEIDPHIKKLVTFSYLNLVEDTYPAILNATNAMDIIFCRNVLMYFSRDRVSAVIHNLTRCLVDGGWLVVGPIEATAAQLPLLLQPVRFMGGLLYRKGETAGNIVERSAALPEGSAQKAGLPGLAKKPAFAGSGRVRQPERVPRVPDAPVGDFREMSRQARLLADRGRLADASALCADALKHHKLNPTLHYLQATILQEMGRSDEAAASLKRALYIDQDFVMAHFALGHLMHRQGRYKEAGKHLGKACALLKGYAHEDIPHEAEGMSAGRLIELIEVMLSIERRR